MRAPWVALASLLLGSLSASAAEVDPESGLVVADHWELVKANCTQCHSARLVVQTRADRGGWLAMIRWMQTTQNLWLFPPETEAAILDYLAEHYAPSSPPFRRAPLPAELLPPLRPPGGR